jgi:signal transduction histidine kinase/CheY-like chemotaxis protein
MPAGQAPDFRILFEALPGAYCVLDPDLVIIAASDAYLRDTRTSRAGIVGRPITEIFPDRPDPCGTATLRASLDIVRSDQVADTIAVDRYNIPAAAPGVEPDARYWSVVNVPVPGPGRRLAYIIHGLGDVTEASESLRGAYNAKKDFLDRLSHELRTPLHTILGFGELLSLDGLSAEHREWITMTLQASRHLVQLMDEAADVAQIEDRTLTLSMEAVPVHRVIADVIEMIRPLALAEGVQIDPPPRPAASQYVRADEQRFRQIMLNLLSNAVKYNYPGGHVTISVGDQPRDQLRVSVTDTGRGIAGQDVGRLFLPFERLDAAQAGVEGAGLGLALSRDLIEAMGGTTGVTSIQGEGSTFWIELPATEPVAVSQLAIERDVIVSSRDYSTAKTVLYAEDMVENFRLVEQILKQRPSVTLLPAMLAGVALDLARQHRPDMILLDLRLPDMPGEEVLPRLRADARTRDIPVVILSADATRQRIDQLRADGVADYLTKPIDVRSLLRTVDSALGEARPGPGSAAGGTRPPALVRRIFSAHYYR